MSSVASPFGLKPAFHPSGIIRQQLSTIVSGHPTDIFQFSPVRIDDASGALIQAVAGSNERSWRLLRRRMDWNRRQATGRQSVGS